MRVMVLGSGGMAGHVIATYLEEQGFDVIRMHGKQEVDIRYVDRLQKFLLDNPYDVVVNCVGVLIGDAEKNKANTVHLNSWLPHFLSTRKSKVIHLSTDCVFSGEDGPYAEDDQKNSDTFYGQSKALGELDNDKDLTFRMSIIGPELKDGSGLFNWFMKQEECNGYTSAIWNGITTLELAKGVEKAIEQDLTGLYHLVPEENITKYELLKLIDEKFDRGVVIKPQKGLVVDNKTLVNTRSDFNYTVPSYETMITELKDWMMNHKELYGRYL